MSSCYGQGHNVDESLKLGREQVVAFEAELPTSFNKTLTKKVIMMASTQKSIKLDGKPVYRIDLYPSHMSAAVQGY
jgi:hypothetical protein